MMLVAVGDRLRTVNELMLMNFKKFAAFSVMTAIIFLNGCQQVQDLSKPTVVSSSLRNVPAQRLGYRFEADVVAPPEVEAQQAPQIEKLTAIQADFDQNRPQDALEKTIVSPDKQRVLAVYQTLSDEKGDFRLDLYETSGRLIRKVTPDGLALRFPDSAVWSPNSANFAFAGARRLNSAANQEIVQEAPRPPELDGTDSSPDPNAAPTASPSPESSPATIQTFRTEQVYLTNRDGGELKPLTQTEGLIYFYLNWSPDGAMLGALACRENEWQILQARAAQAGEVFRPLGRPRLLEKNGRERRLDDGLSGVYPVWSPDSSKIATAFDKQVRIYDAVGTAPTAASIPLQVPLLIASKVCEDKIAAQQSCVNPTQAELNINNAEIDSSKLATFLPVIALRWMEDKTLYMQTGFVKDPIQGEPVRSFMRWHRLNLSPQAAAL